MKQKKETKQTNKHQSYIQLNHTVHDKIYNEKKKHAKKLGQKKL